MKSLCGRLRCRHPRLAQYAGKWSSQEIRVAGSGRDGSYCTSGNRVLGNVIRLCQKTAMKHFGKHSQNHTHYTDATASPIGYQK
ncbi:hypothetical protein STEG23_027634 [Scotinomys teguina]